ncbi:hypothetical protein TL16_g13415, partial [Triparma laevis f. inornata]
IEAKSIVVPASHNLARAVGRAEEDELNAQREKEALKKKIVNYAETAGEAGGNVYMQEDRLVKNKNRRMLDSGEIDRQFG